MLLAPPGPSPSIDAAIETIARIAHTLRALSVEDPASEGYTPRPHDPREAYKKP